MTAPATKTVRSDGDKQSGANVRRGGRNFMIAFYAALRAIKLYPLEHSAVQETLKELAQIAEELHRWIEEGRLKPFYVEPEEAKGIDVLAEQLELSVSELVTLAIDHWYGEGGSR